jgi:hypothetical protein
MARIFNSLARVTSLLYSEALEELKHLILEEILKSMLNKLLTIPNRTPKVIMLIYFKTTMAKFHFKLNENIYDGFYSLFIYRIILSYINIYNKYKRFLVN